MQRRQIAAWLVHLYTASGAIVGIFALIVAAQGETREAFLLLMLTGWIDATDGLMARRIRVWQVLPQFDGAMMDNIIDVLTYVWVPVFIMAHENLLPHPLWIAIPVVAALYAYGQTGMKSEDSFFIGFPSYWNIIALYMYWLEPVAWVAVLVLVIPAILSFIPTRYLYPSKNRFLWRTSWVLALLWTPLMVYLLFQDDPNQTLVLISLYYPAYYMLASFYVEWRIRTGRPRPA